jgi:hypothetical protein
MDISANIYSNVFAITKSEIMGLTKAEVQCHTASVRVIDSIRQYTREINGLVNISTFFSSSITSNTSDKSNSGRNILCITCSIIWQITSEDSDDGIQQMIVDFVIKFASSNNEIELIGVYENLPRITEIGLYEVNDRAIGIKNPRDLLRFV